MMGTEFAYLYNYTISDTQDTNTGPNFSGTCPVIFIVSFIFISSGVNGDSLRESKIVIEATITRPSLNDRPPDMMSRARIDKISIGDILQTSTIKLSLFSSALSEGSAR